MVETGGLENRWARKGPGGSNPPPSARQSGFLSFSVEFCPKTLICRPKCANVAQSRNVGVHRTQRKDANFAIFLRGIRSSAFLRDQEIGGSNPLAPTICFNNLSRTLGLSSTPLQIKLWIGKTLISKADGVLASDNERERIQSVGVTPMQNPVQLRRQNTSPSLRPARWIS